MKYIRIFLFTVFMLPFASFAAQNEFQVAAQLLAAAKSADIQQVQSLVNSGANVNYVDSTGLSIVCTALMNNDVRAAQILQMYGADASKCDQQIKKYNSKNKPKSSGGLFSGLSSAQSIALTAAGAAVVVGGLFLLTDLFDPGNDNEAPSSGGSHGGSGNGGGTTGGEAVAAFAVLPYGPGCDLKTGKCQNVEEWAKTEDFKYMENFNYLMMAYGYNAFARGYFGMDTVRITSDKTPFDLRALPFAGEQPSGGKPVGISVITANGVNATGSLADGLIDWVDDSLIATAQAQCTQYGSASTQCTTAMGNLVKISRKFLNRTNLSDLGDLTELAKFDLSGHGTVFGDATNGESSYAKVIAGWEYGGRASGDAYGFAPSAVLGIYRTGGGLAVDSVVGASANADENTVWTTGDTFTLNGATYKITMNGNSFTATNTADAEDVLTGVQSGAILSFVQNDVNYEAQFKGDVVSMKVADLMNYRAMLSAASLTEDTSVIANVAQNPQSTSTGYVNMNGLKSFLAANATTENHKKSIFLGTINDYYNLNTDDDAIEQTPGQDANALFATVGNTQKQIIVNSVGAYEYGTGEGKAIDAQVATFENYAPVLYPYLEHLFASVVAVQNTKGTSGASSISGYTPGDSSVGKIALSTWRDGYNNNGTPDDVSDDYFDHVYSSRKCGDAGLGLNGIDPWCFAAPGENSEMAVASMAGAIASVQSAFAYLAEPQVFELLALTADGAYLGTNPGSGQKWTNESELVSYLQGRYDLPGEYSPQTDADYLKAFKEVFGYGLINLERATRPGTTIYFFDGNSIVSVNNNAYWRAATNTNFRASSVLNLDGATISAPYYDMLASADGDMYMARIWENKFNLGGDSERALYMGDVLGELKTRNDTVQRSQVGNIGFSMAVSDKAYVDNLNGLDMMALDYNHGNWNFAASFQRYFTDGASRFDGMANPVLNLATNVLVSDVEYKHGNWAFGGRAFSGMATDEGLMENDPTISSQYMPAKLGLMQGAQSHATYANDKFAFTASVGAMAETDTLLGAYSDGLLNMGNGKTTYVDAYAKYDLMDNVSLMGRATFARTKSDADGMVVLGLSDIDSNAFAVGANVGNLEFTVSQPLAIRDGALQYAYAEYDAVENSDGNFDLVVRDTHIENVSLRPDEREVRFAGTYRHSFGEFTDGAVGFIYRVNPNHTDKFGNESVFMMKMTHRLGI